MIGAGIDDGDLVLIKMTKKAELGQIVAALDENNQSTLKRLVFDEKKERPVLRAENRHYKDICPQQIVIQGVAVKVIKDLL
jgi:repressor LexA